MTSKPEPDPEAAEIAQRVKKSSLGTDSEDPVVDYSFTESELLGHSGRRSCCWHTGVALLNLIPPLGVAYDHFISAVHSFAPLIGVPPPKQGIEAPCLTCMHCDSAYRHALCAR